MVVLVKDLDVAGHDVKRIHALDLFLLLLALGDCSVLGKLVDVVQHLLFLVGKQVFQDLVDVLAEQKRVVFFGVVQDADQPVQMVVVERLGCDVFRHSRDSQRMLPSQFLAVLACLLAVELAVEADGPADGLVETQVVPALFLHLLALVTKHEII